MIELPNHPFFVACQYHPEFKSAPYSRIHYLKSLLKLAEEETNENKMEFICGLCVLESEDLAMSIAERLKEKLSPFLTKSILPLKEVLIRQIDQV